MLLNIKIPLFETILATISKILLLKSIEHSKAVTTVSSDRLNSRENKKMFHYSLKILYYNSETKAAKAVELKNLLLHLEV